MGDSNKNKVDKMDVLSTLLEEMEIINNLMIKFVEELENHVDWEKLYAEGSKAPELIESVINQIKVNRRIINKIRGEEERDENR